jgi:FixJ family two-component response regulator
MTPTVLVVDDDAAVRGALKFALEIEGFKVRLYADALSVLADRDLPAEGCFIVDDRMPGMDGLELVERLRASDIGLPVILICSLASPALRHRAHRAGVSAVLEKPLSDGALVESLRSAHALRSTDLQRL